MTGRDMDKAKKTTAWHLVGLLVLLAWAVFLISNLPKNPIPRDWYMTGSEIFVADMLALALLSVIALIGITIGRFIEARQYQKNGRYLGKDSS